MRSADGATAPPAAIAYRPRRMVKLVAAMLSWRMAVDGGPPPKFPLWAVYGVSDFDSAGRPVGGQATDYETALARILGGHGQTDQEGIPTHKLSTNLGWHVTADECTAALRHFNAGVAAGRDATVFGKKLLPFLRAAAAGDGFEVH
jgi:hypothetical protein